MEAEIATPGWADAILKASPTSTLSLIINWLHWIALHWIALDIKDIMPHTKALGQANISVSKLFFSR